MKRFTRKDMYGKYEISAYDGFIRSEVCWGEDSEEFFYGEPIDRLGQYEDIGLTPDEIMLLLQHNKE